jgi:hypothetical protein
MIAAAPEGSLPWRIRNKQFKKTLPAVPRRGPEAWFHRIHCDSHGLVRTLFSCLFLQSQKKFLSPNHYDDAPKTTPFYRMAPRQYKFRSENNGKDLTGAPGAFPADKTPINKKKI